MLNSAVRKRWQEFMEYTTQEVILNKLWEVIQDEWKKIDPAKLYCIAEHKVDIAAKAEPVWVLKAVDGKLFTLLKTRRSLALFDDPRLRGRALIMKGRVFPGTQVLEVTFIQSVRKGVVHDVFYYCDICVIKFLAPGPCVCCREPVVLMEKPAGKKNAPVD